MLHDFKFSLFRGMRYPFYYNMQEDQANLPWIFLYIHRLAYLMTHFSPVSTELLKPVVLEWAWVSHPVASTEDV